MFFGRAARSQHHQVTAIMKWNKKVNKVGMEYFCRSKLFDVEGKHIRGYKQIMFKKWRNRGLLKSTEQRVCNQARETCRNCWLLQLNLKNIKRQVKDNFQGVFGEDVATEVEKVENKDTTDNEDMIENEVESVSGEIVSVEEVNSNTIDSGNVKNHYLNDENQKTVE